MSSLNLMETQDSLIYGVDYSGRVWSLNQSKHQNNYQWNILTPVNKIDVKRLTSASTNLWAISSDHQIYVLVSKQHVSIRFREEIYENQRWNPVGGFCENLLPTDRPPFSDETGLINRDKKYIELPSSSWSWEGDWQIENTFDNQLLSQDGWTYAIDFPASYKPEKSWNSMVRRRKLFRYRRFVAINKWNKIPALHDDVTKEPFVDVAAAEFLGSTSGEVCVWAISVLGQIYFRMDVSKTNPEGFRWVQVEIPKGLEAAQVSISAQGIPFIVTWTGSFLFRIGITPHNLIGTDWIEIQGPSNGLFQISVGENMMWGLTRDKKCWTLKGTLQELIKSSSTQVEWLEIPGRMKCISVSKNDQNVLGISEDEGVLMIRYGITEEQRYGQQWKEALPDVSWDTVSTSSRVSDISDCVDGGGSDTASTAYSIHPDIPTQENFNISSGSDPGETVSLCWIDGACSSVLKAQNDGDLEVGPWREEILTNLQSLKVGTEKFDYPNAVEPSCSSWSKSVNAKMTYKSKKKAPVSGQLEISNNDTLVFHKGMQNSWICNMKDVLSVFWDSEACLTFSLRIRNSFEEGKAEVVQFRFANEKEAEEWKAAVADLSLKMQEECKVANIWLATEHGEVQQGGQIKIADTPSEMDIITPNPGDSLKYHHPLVRGFFPGSELRMDISIPQDSERFAFNFKGGENTAFHFNPRFDSSTVVRNTYDKGEWGQEERDGVFPFIKGENYTVLFQCTDTHLVAIITIKNRRFTWAYKHRMLPRLISVFTAVGDVNVTSIRYDPATPEDLNRLEFVMTPVPGHFWKIAAAADGIGHIWALSYDMSPWVYRFNPKKTPKLEHQPAIQMNEIYDEKILVTYENQRWNPLSGFTSHGLPTDRQPWTDETGRIKLDKDDIKLPSSKWAWASEWEIDFSLKEGVDKDGWQYAIDFPAVYRGQRKFNDFVRRRRWKRTCRFTTTGPWESVPGIKLKLVDICLYMNADCDWELLGLCETGEVVARKGITPENPIGDRFEDVPTEKPMVSISAWYGQKVWAIGKDGFAYIRYSDHWQLLDRPQSSPLKKVCVGPNAVFSLGTNKTLYRRTSMQPVFPEGRDWSKVCDGVYDMSVSADGTLWAIIKSSSGSSSDQRTLATRIGITENNPNGLAWEVVCIGPWRSFTASGVYSRSGHAN